MAKLMSKPHVLLRIAAKYHLGSVQSRIAAVLLMPTRLGSAWW